jgi:hypothetical protein
METILNRIASESTLPTTVYGASIEFPGGISIRTSRMSLFGNTYKIQINGFGGRGYDVSEAASIVTELGEAVRVAALLETACVETGLTIE